MSYIVFARKYRPQGFDDIIGQSHITTTLKNAISKNRVAHAYLFAGPRGVGKTTTARILAKALNCEKGPTHNPCNECSTCKEITQGTSLDILEIDGASNRGIDEIRNLRENVKFAPSKGRFKVYIIDEVHMLTAEAFNALLKTLEEPPPHVKFIFATTQGHKVPQTILSRCQRFDFRRISSKDIFDNLKRIAKTEKLNIADEALVLIAKYSDGGMRDAQVTLDQVTSFARDKIGPGDVSKLIGVVDDEMLFGLSDAISKKDPSAGLILIDRIISEGKDPLQIVLGLIGHFRNMSMVKISKDLDPLIDASEDKIKEYTDHAGQFTIEEILYVIYTLSNTIDFIRKTSLARIPLEAAIVKLAKKGSTMPLDDVMKKIGMNAPAINKTEEPVIKKTTETVTKKIEAPAPKEKEAAPANATAAEAPSQDRRMADILHSWPKVLNHIMAKKISVASYLQEGCPIGVEAHTITIAFSKGLQFHKEVLEGQDNRKLIEAAIQDVLQMKLKVHFVLSEYGNGNSRNGQGTGADDAEDISAGDPREVDPIVKSALDVFGGNISGNGSARRVVQ